MRASPVPLCRSPGDLREGQAAGRLGSRKPSWIADRSVPNIDPADVVNAPEETSRLRLQELTSILNQAFATIGPGPYQLIVLCLGGGVYAAEGSLLLMLSIIAKGLIIRYKLTPLLAGFMATVIFAGLLIGTVLGGFCCDRFGRRKPILLTYAGITVFIFVGILSPGFLMLLSAKFMLGFCLGFGLPSANAIVAESSPPAHRSNIYCLTMVLFSMGQLFSATIVWVVSPEIQHDEMHWRGMLAAATLLPIVQFIFATRYLEESPHWLLVNWKIREAADVVAQMAEWKFAAGVSLEEGEKLNTLVHEELPSQLRPPRLESFDVKDDETVDGDDSGSDQRQISKGVPTPEAEGCAAAGSGGGSARSRSASKRRGTNESVGGRRASGSKEAPAESMYRRMLRGDGLQMEVDRFMMLFSPAFYRTTVLMLYVCFSSNFAYYGMIYGLPDTLKEAALEAERQGAENYDSRGRGWSPAAGVFLGAMSEIPGVCLAIVLGMTVGRRKNMCFAFSMCSLSLVGVVHCISTQQLLHNAGMVAVLSVKLFLATGYIVVYLYLLECYPTTCRATGLATCMVFGRFGAACVPFLYDGARLVGVENVGFWFFITMAIVVFCASVVTCALPFETKDAELVADIVETPNAAKAYDPASHAPGRSPPLSPGRGGGELPEEPEQRGGSKASKDADEPRPSGRAFYSAREASAAAASS